MSFDFPLQNSKPPCNNAPFQNYDLEAIWRNWTFRSSVCLRKYWGQNYLALWWMIIWLLVFWLVSRKYNFRVSMCQLSDCGISLHQTSLCFPVLAGKSTYSYRGWREQPQLRYPTPECNTLTQVWGSLFLHEQDTTSLCFMKQSPCVSYFRSKDSQNTFSNPEGRWHAMTVNVCR